MQLRISDQEQPRSCLAPFLRPMLRGYATVYRLSVWLSVCLSLYVTFKYRDHIGWNTSKLISRPNSLRYLLTLTTTLAIWFNRNTPNEGGIGVGS